MLLASQLRELIIKPALLDLVLFNEEAMELLVFTCAVESEGGTYLKQIKGPALGIYQMEPEDYNDLWSNYLLERRPLMLMLSTNFGVVTIPDESRLVYDLRYATAMARLHYERIPTALPAKPTPEHLWEYYKKYYNTYLGAATKDESIAKYLAFAKT